MILRLQLRQLMKKYQSESIINLVEDINDLVLILENLFLDIIIEILTKMLIL